MVGYVSLQNFDVVDESSRNVEGLVGWAREGNIILVSNGAVTKSNCGTFSNEFVGCDDGHDGLMYNG